MLLEREPLQWFHFLSIGWTAQEREVLVQAVLVSSVTSECFYTANSLILDVKSRHNSALAQHFACTLNLGEL
jgi:hypothetical protein